MAVPHDRLDVKALEGLGLSAATTSVLVHDGLPHLLRLPNWLGPELFASELHQPSISPVEAFLDPQAIANLGVAGYVLGSIRETEEDGVGEPRAIFVLTTPNENIILVDLGGPGTARFVNSTLANFRRFLTRFAETWPKLVSNPPALSGFVEDLRIADPHALESPESYWSYWLFEELSA